MKALQDLLDRVVIAPPEWFSGVAKAEEERPALEALPCSSYDELVDVWKDTRNEPGGKPGAIFWTDSIDVTFSAMLAVVASTKQQGAQIWLRVIGPPGSVKSTLCEAVGTNRQYTKSMTMFTGIHSGQEGQEIFSQMNGKTVIIHEGDMLNNAPNKDQTLAQMREMWGGRVRADYRNGVNYDLQGLRTTWIVAGTSTLRKLNRSAAGDRFIDSIIHERQVKGGADKGEMELLERVAQMSLRLKTESNGNLDSQDDPFKILAMRKTAGFVQYLRETTAEKAAALEVPLGAMKDCIALAQLVAYMRARPDEKAESDETEVELATRLTEQFVRMSSFIAIVMGRQIDAEVLRRVAILAKNTCMGRTFKVCEVLSKGPKDAKGIGAALNYKPDTVAHCTTVLQTIGCIKADMTVAPSGALGRGKGVYRLSPQMVGLVAKLNALLHPGTKVVKTNA